MRVRWRGLELPSRVQRDTTVSTDTYGRFTAEPFERGFGTTVGNSLRRILLSILNIKSLVVKLDADEEKEMKVVAKKAGPITAGMIDADPAITVVSKDLVLATLTEDVHFEMKMTVGKGRGYVTAGEHVRDEEEQEIGIIPVDSIFSPVTRVRYATEDARVGQKTDYDRLTLEGIHGKKVTHKGDLLIDPLDRTAHQDGSEGANLAP